MLLAAALLTIFLQAGSEGIQAFTAQSGVLYKSASFTAPVLREFEVGDEITVLRYDPQTDYFEVVIGELRGFVTPGDILTNSKIAQMRQKPESVESSDIAREKYIETAERQAAEIKSKAAARARRTRLEKRFGVAVAARILRGEDWLGMSKEMALEALGKPSGINRTLSATGTHEQWVYPGSTYLYFTNSKLAVVQDSKTP